MINYFSIFLLICFYVSNSQHIIEILLEKSSSAIRLYNIYVEGYSNPISLSLLHSFSYVDYSYFTQKYKSISEHPHIIKQNPYSNDYFLFKEKIKFIGTKDYFNFLFYAKNTSKVTESDKDLIDFLSLRYNSAYNNESLIYLLYEQKVIPNKIFYIFLKANQLFLGGIPSNHQLQFKGKHIVSLKYLNLHGWNFHLTSIQMGKIFLDFPQKQYRAILELSGTSISIPSKFFDQIIYEYFTKYYENRDCYLKKIEMWEKENDYYESGVRIWCKKNIIGIFPEVKFGIENFDIVLSKDYLFKCDDRISEEYCIFELADRNNVDTFLFGSTFFKDYYIKFDYEEKSISFYLPLKVRNVKLIRIFLYIYIIVLLYGILWILYTQVLIIQRVLFY